MGGTPPGFAHSHRMLRRKPSPSTIAIAAVMVFFTLVAWRWSWNQGPVIIRSDAEGYYGYLRAVFINHDLGHERPNGTYLHETADGTLNKYFAGEAVMLTPFFLAAHGWAHLSGAPTDGLSTPYMRAISLAGLAYALLGLLAFRSLLRKLGISETVATAVVLVIGLGTQLVQYTSIQPGWSHVYSFCMVCVFLLLTARLADGLQPWPGLAWGISFGLIVLLRPVNGLVALAIPVVLGSTTLNFIRSLLGRWKLVLASALAAGAVVFIQCALWYAQVGHFIADGYKGEGFHWSRPEFLQVLIGFRRGLFLWTPVLLPALLSALAIWPTDRVRALASLTYWAVNTYVIASWWIWYYGSGWGSRVYIDHYPVLFVPLAMALDRWRAHAPYRWLWKGMAALLAVASLFTMAQFYQYNHRMFHPEAMDSRKYAYSFLRFDEDHRDRLGGNYRIAPFHPNGLDTLLHEKWDAEGTWSHWLGRRLRADDAPSPGHIVVCDLVDAFGPSFTMRASELPKGRELYLAIGFERSVERVDDTRSVVCITTLEDSCGTQSFYEPFAMEPLPPIAARKWEHIEYRIHVPAAHAGEDLKFYFWNKESRACFRADDLDVTVLSVRPY